MFEWISSPEAWIALFTLTVLEVVLGIDNIIFVAILADRVKESQRQRARRVGLTIAITTRILLLFSIASFSSAQTSAVTVPARSPPCRRTGRAVDPSHRVEKDLKNIDFIWCGWR